ncbi:hypothetical protein D3C75_1347880 [compost metagenome]
MSWSAIWPNFWLASLDWSAARAFSRASEVAWVTFWLMSSTTWDCSRVALAIEAFSSVRLRSAVMT